MIIESDKDDESRFVHLLKRCLLTRRPGTEEAPSEKTSGEQR